MLDEFGLGIWRPYDVARPVAVAEAGPIEDDNPVVLGSKTDQTAGFEVLNHAAVAVQKNQRVTRASLNVVKPNTVDIQEAAGRRIVMFGFLRKMTID